MGDPVGIFQLVEQVDQKHDDAHKRLRADLQACVATLTSLTAQVDRNYRYFDDQSAAFRLRMEEVRQLAMTPVDATKLTLSTRAILTLVGTVSALIITVMGTYWATVTKIDNLGRDLTAARDQISRIEQQRIDDKREAAQKLSDFLNQRLENAIIANSPKGPKK